MENGEHKKERNGKAQQLTIEEHMLNAAELLHYADKFRDHIFACILGDTDWLSDIFLDLKIFYLARIKILICCPRQAGLQEKLQRWNPRGYPLDYLEAEAGTLSASLAQSIASSLSARRIPVVALNHPKAVELPLNAFHDDALRIAARAGAHKALLMGSLKYISLNDRQLSHLSPLEVEQLPPDTRINVPMSDLQQIVQRQMQHGMEIVILSALPGNLFQEVFTHEGVGTLFSEEYQNVLRQAALSDARDIAFLTKPYIDAGIMLPVNEDEIAASISDYYVYIVNGETVAVGMLRDYEDAFELCKLATLPRYRGKGLARSLIDELLKSARKSEKRYVFALTIDPKTGDFFEKAGFMRVARESLPEKWRAHYDFSRPSIAYRFEL